MSAGVRGRRPVAILGATGVAGRQALAALDGHPWFELVAVASSPRTAGRRLGDVVPGLPASQSDLRLQDGDAFDARGVDAVFSALPSPVARRLEPAIAATTPVLSTASAFRDEPDTPLLLPGVNGDHAALLQSQRRRRGWKGFVAPGPNCTVVGLAVTLAPLQAAAGVRAVVLTSMQSISGAGGDGPRVAALVAGNLLPYIAGEEEKVEREARKILGAREGETTRPAGFAVSATCTRVAVDHGHTLSVAVALERALSPEDAAACLAAHDPWAGRRLPSVPARWIEVRPEPDRPQPALDREAGGGMTTVVGRLREDRVLGGLKYVVVSHNAVLGAMGGAVLLAEDLVDRGML